MQVPQAQARQHINQVVVVEQGAPHNLCLQHYPVEQEVLVDITKHSEIFKTVQAVGLQVVVQVVDIQTARPARQMVVEEAAATGMAHGHLI
jgi:diaminopimelate epimerase